MRPLLIDAFLYNGEEDILELRYQVLKDRVDRFLLVEGNLTFTGLPRLTADVPAYDRMDYLTVTDFPEASPRNAWKREMWQRNAILKPIRDLPDETLVMVSDVDEIPDPNDIPERLEPHTLIRYQHQFYHFNFNNHVIRDDSANKGWSCTALCRLDDLRMWYPQGVRNQVPAQVIQSGWHFSWFHDPQNKLDSYSHQELKRIDGDIPTKVQERWGYQYEYISGTRHLPKVVQENPARWAKYFKDTDNA